jgi:hypothetical protein
MQNAQTMEQVAGRRLRPARLGSGLECGIFLSSQIIGWRENNNTS